MRLFRQFHTSTLSRLIARRPLPLVGAPKDPTLQPNIPLDSPYVTRPFILSLAQLDQVELDKKLKQDGAEGYRWLKVTQLRSSTGLPPKVKDVLRVLRLKRRLRSTYHPPTPIVLGQILHPFMIPILRVTTVPITEVIDDLKTGRAEGKGRRAKGEERGYVVIRRIKDREITPQSLGL